MELCAKFLKLYRKLDLTKISFIQKIQKVPTNVPKSRGAHVAI